MNWKNLKDQLPTRNTLVILKRLPNKIETSPIYLGMRQNRELSTNNDLSQDCFWWGTNIKELNNENESVYELRMKSNFSDLTVDSWCYISEYFNSHS